MNSIHMTSQTMINARRAIRHQFGAKPRSEVHRYIREKYHCYFDYSKQHVVFEHPAAYTLFLLKYA